MVYDSARRVTVLFGGFGASGPNRETWEWDGTGWLLRATSGPRARREHAMAYDSVRGVTVLFGGIFSSSPVYLGDTWEWDGADWALRAANGPTAQAGHSAAFDVARGVTVVSSPINVPSSAASYTWEWNGAAWNLLLVTGPSARREAAMVYDAAHGCVLLFGGGSGFASGETWRLRPACISISTPTSPTNRSACLGRDETLAVTTTGTGPLAYQWRKNTIAILPGENPSATTATLTLGNVQPADAGYYDCIITNACGSTTSPVITLSTRTCGCSAADIAGGGADGLSPDGVSDAADFVAFMNSFSAANVGMDARADIAGAGPNGDEPDGIIDGNDFTLFVNAYSMGC
jgi:hypothetical protein